MKRKRRDLAAFEQRRGVVELAVLAPRRAEQHRRPVTATLAREVPHRRLARGDKSRFQHQILGRIAGSNEKLGGDDEIGMRGLRLAPGIAQAAKIAGDIADGRIELGDEDTETQIGHAELA